MSKPQLSDTDYGFNGLVRIFNEKEIEMNEWVIERLDKERGGIKFVLPNAEGKIYLTWGDLYQVDVVFVTSQKRYNQTVMLGELYEIIDALEKSRLRVKKTIADMLMKAFKSEEE